MYPVQERLVEGLGVGDAATLVDVVGGTGQILQEFRSSVPQYAGKLILQELPEVIAIAKQMGVEKDAQVVLQEHDFFKA